MSTHDNQSRFKLKAVSATLAVAVAFGVGFGIFVLQDHKVNIPSNAATSCTPNAILEFSCRSIVGAAAHGNPGIPGQPKPGTDSISQFTYLESLLNIHLDIFRMYHAPIGTAGNPNATYPFDPSTSEGKAEIHFANRANTYVDLNWNPSNSWLQSSGGNATINKQIDQTAAYIKSVAPHKVFLSPWHEANLHVGAKDNSTQNCSHLTSASNSNGTPSQFIAAWKNIRSRFKDDGVTNVVWIWGLGSYTPDDCWVQYMWPGSGEVDWLNYDTYGRVNKLTWDDSSGVFYNYLLSHSTAAHNWNAKPWGIGEFGDGAAPTQQDGYNYFNNIISDLKTNKYPKLKMYMIYADTGNATPLGTLTDFDSNGTYDPQKQKIINTMFSTMIGGSSGGQPTPTVSITSPSSGSTVKGTASLSASASVSSGSITKLVVSAAGSTVKTCSSSPCTASWDTTKVSNGTKTISATATASDGMSSSTSETVTVNNTPPAPSIPVNITSPSQTTTAISLSWSASTDANYQSSQLVYHVFRNGATVGATAAGVTSFTDKALSPGTYYSYTVAASDPAGRTSAQSAAFTQNTKTPNCAKPAAPGGLSGTASSPTIIALHWNAVANPSSSCVILHYVVSRATVPLAQPTTTSYTDSSVTADTTYSYTVLAVETGNIAGPSSSVSVTTPKPTQQDPGPSAPSNVNGTAISTTQINLSWGASTDSVSGIKQYTILRNGSQVGSATTTSFGDSGLSAGTTYHYQVVAVSGDNKTAASSTVSVTTLQPSGKPGGNPGGNGGGNTGGSSPATIPILQGTHSVGSGSDTGQSSSQNPTAGSPSGNGSGNANGSTSSGTGGISKQPAKSKSSKTAAYVGGALLALIIIIGFILWRRARLNNTNSWGGQSDPDLLAHAGDTIHPNEPTQPGTSPADWQPPQSGDPMSPNNQPPQPPDSSEDQNSDPFRRGQ